jgi:hypothetical protein
MKFSALFASTLCVAAVGCGSDSNSTVDSPKAIDAPPDAPKSNCPPPATVPAMITVGGKASEVAGLGIGASANVTVEGFRTGSTIAEVTGTSATDGSYSVTFNSNGTAVDGYLRGKKTGLLDSYLYPGNAIAANIANAPVLMLTAANVNLLANLTSVTVTPGTNLVAVGVTDCMGNNIAGATVTTTPATLARYNRPRNGKPFPNATATTTDTDGVAYLFNAPAGNITINVTGTATPYAPRVIKVIDGTMTASIASP